MATPYYLQAPEGDQAQPSFWQRLSSGIDRTPSDSFYSLASALVQPGPFGRNLTQGLVGFGKGFAEDKKRKGLASAFDSMAAGVPEAQRPIFDQLVKNNPEALMQGYAGQLFSKPAEQPSGVKEYLFAVSNDGYRGSFSDWSKEQKRAGASNTTVNVGGEKAFEKGVGEFQAKSFGSIAEEGVAAKGDLSSITELETRLQATPGGIVGGIQALGNSIGIPIGKGASDAQAANAIIARLVPTQRTPGSGQMSDRDVLLFRDSLPKLINSPEGNALIISTMKAMAQFKIDQARIAGAAMSGQITRQQAQEAIMNLPDPMAQFKARQGGGTVAPGPRKVLKWNPTTGTAE